jgi:hypothetical protein
MSELDLEKAVEPDDPENAPALPERVEQQLAKLRATSDEQTRTRLEYAMQPSLADKPLDPADEMSGADVTALEAELARLDPSAPSTKVVRGANHEVGYHENGTNCTKYGRWYGIECTEWCDMFVSWVFDEAGQLKAIGGKHKYVPAHYDWFRQHKRFHARGAKGGGPRVGCLIFIDFNGHDGADHIGIVVSYDDTHVHTVEGNRSNAVRRCTYSRSSHLIFGYGYPSWS